MSDEQIDSTIVLSIDAARASEDQVHYLRVTGGRAVGRKIELGPEPIVLGRGKDATARLDEKGISKRHCSVHLAFGGAVVEDLGSTNGTFVNGSKLARAEGLLEVGGTLQVGETTLQYERLSREESQRIDRLEKDLDKAEDYVRALLPEPLDGEHVAITYRFVPSTAVGGDALGYHWLDETRLAIYLIDVSGHGAGSGLHSVTAYNALRKESLPNVDFSRPDQVLSALNTMYRMSDHAGLYLTAWYGVYEPGNRRLTYASAGHPPAILVTAAGETLELATPSRAVGLFDGTEFVTDQAEIPTGAILHVYSDGAYEFDTAGGREWGLESFKQLLAARYDGAGTRPEQIERRVREVLEGRAFEDDFSLLVVEFR